MGHGAWGIKILIAVLTRSLFIPDAFLPLSLFCPKVVANPLNLVVIEDISKPLKLPDPWDYSILVDHQIHF